MWPHRQQPTRLPRPWDSPGKNTGVAISFSNAWKWKVKVKSLSCVWLLATPSTAADQAPPPMGFSRQEYWSGVPLPSPLPYFSEWQTENFKRPYSVHGVFQRRILEWVAISFSRGSSSPRDQTHVSSIGRRILFHWAPRKAPNLYLKVTLIEDQYISD